MKLTHLLVVAIVAIATPVLAAPTQAQLYKERAETAAKVYTQVRESLKAGRATTEAAYQWSVRWLESDYERATDAKAKKQALVDHAARMLALEADATKMQQAGALGTVDAIATTYFRIEADLWVLRGKAH